MIDAQLVNFVNSTVPYLGKIFRVRVKMSCESSLASDEAELVETNQLG